MLPYIKLKNYQQYTDKELLSLLIQNNQAAFTELYNRFWKKLFAVAYNRLKEVQAAEDIVHDVFAGLWANRHKPGINLIENYLATSVKYGVLNTIKKKERERQYQQSVHRVSVMELPAETALHYKRILELVKSEVEKLPQQCKLIFKYSRNEGMPIKQIADKLSISSKTVENQLNKALKQLKLATRSFFHTFLFFF